MSGKRKSPDLDGTTAPKRQHIEAWLDVADVPVASVEPSEVDIPPSPPPQLASTIATTQMTNYESSRSPARSSAPSGALNADSDHEAFKRCLEMHNIRDGDWMPDKCKPKPHNWDELQKVLQLERSSPELQESDMTRIDTLTKNASNETQMNHWLCPYIVKDVDWIREPFAMRILQEKMWTRAIPVVPPTFCPLSRPKPAFTFGYDTVEAFTSIGQRDGHLTLFSPLREALDHGPHRRSFSRPASDIRFPMATIETFFLKEVGIAHVQNMRNAAVMLNIRVELLRKAGLAIPYGKAFIFSIDLSFTDDTKTRLNCHWIERDEASRKDIYWTRTLAKLNCNRDSTREEFDETRRACKNLIEYAIQSNHTSISAEFTALVEVLERRGFETGNSHPAKVDAGATNAPGIELYLPRTV